MNASDLEICPFCEGEGDDEFGICPECDGNGFVDDDFISIAQGFEDIRSDLRQIVE